VVSGATLVHLVRHGESVWNAARRVQGQSLLAPSLTDLGRAQARTAAELLTELAPRARLVLSSDLARARETALIVAAGMGLPLRCDPGLREQHLGELEGRHFAEEWEGLTVEDTVDGLWLDATRRPPGGESIRDLHRRVHAALARLAAELAAVEVVVVTHGGPIRVASSASAATLSRHPVANASVTTLAVAAAWRARRAS
jgi:probable phosphoglycerate mutase